MLPWKVLEQATVPGGGSMTLCQRSDEFVIRVDNRDLMSSKIHGSEEALAKAVLTDLPTDQGIQVLIGGLGLGYTARAALTALESNAEVTVAELVPDLVEWVRGVLSPLAGDVLSDPRIKIAQGDVRVGFEKLNFWDAIILDVDNGPDAFTRPDNQSLYSVYGLRKIYHALRPGGRLGVWSLSGDEGFEKRLQLAGFRCDTRRVPAREGKGRKRHTLFIARVPGAGEKFTEVEQAQAEMQQEQAKSKAKMTPEKMSKQLTSRRFVSIKPERKGRK
jgi:hypothetical protein